MDDKDNLVDCIGGKKNNLDNDHIEDGTPTVESENAAISQPLVCKSVPQETVNVIEKEEKLILQKRTKTDYSQARKDHTIPKTKNVEGNPSSYPENEPTAVQPNIPIGELNIIVSSSDEDEEHRSTDTNDDLCDFPAKSEPMKPLFKLSEPLEKENTLHKKYPNVEKLINQDFLQNKRTESPESSSDDEKVSLVTDPVDRQIKAPKGKLSQLNKRNRSPRKADKSRRMLKHVQHWSDGFRRFVRVDAEDNAVLSLPFSEFRYLVEAEMHVAVVQVANETMEYYISRERELQEESRHAQTMLMKELIRSRVDNQRLSEQLHAAAKRETEILAEQKTLIEQVNTLKKDSHHRRRRNKKGKGLVLEEAPMTVNDEEH